jgi:serine/threonine protein kinase
LDKIVLIDFGTAKVFTTTTKKNQQPTTLLRTFCGSDFFRATEIGQAMSYGPSVDLYSCGKTLLVAFYGFFTHRKARALYLRQQKAAAAREAAAASARAMVVTPVTDRRRRAATGKRASTTTGDEPLLIWHSVWKLDEVYNPRVAPNPFVENMLRLAEEKPTKRPTMAVALRLFHNADNVVETERRRQARDFATATAQLQHS